MASNRREADDAYTISNTAISVTAEPVFRNSSETRSVDPHVSFSATVSFDSNGPATAFRVQLRLQELCSTSRRHRGVFVPAMAKTVDLGNGVKRYIFTSAMIFLPLHSDEKHFPRELRTSPNFHSREFDASATVFRRVTNDTVAMLACSTRVTRVTEIPQVDKANCRDESNEPQSQSSQPDIIESKEHEDEDLDYVNVRLSQVSRN